MIIKVCGLKDNQNIQEIIDLNIDWIGYNFYKPSSRYITTIPSVNEKIHQKKVGVFVNEDIESIINHIDKFKLDIIQLHGNETPEYCKQVQSLKPIIKVFRIHENFNFDILDNYSEADYFLFDTETKNYGGSGIKFNWNVLNNVTICRPFLLSGGIEYDDWEKILNFDAENYVGIDINSKFEISPGIKDVTLINEFVNNLKK